MDVINKNAGFVTNIEALEVIRNRQQKRSAQMQQALVQQKNSVDSVEKVEPKDFLKVDAIRVREKQLRTLKWMEDEVQAYIKNTAASVQTISSVSLFLAKLVQLQEEDPSYSLTQAERMQLINVRATQQIEAHLILEECSERFTDEQLDVILNLADKYLPSFIHPDVVAQDDDTMEEE